MEAATELKGVQHRNTSGHTAAQLIRWRKLDSVLRSTLFEPYISPLVQGTWLMNVWLKAMGAQVSMGSLVLGLVKDYDMIEVSGRTKPLGWCGEVFLMFLCRTGTKASSGCVDTP